MRLKWTDARSPTSPVCHAYLRNRSCTHGGAARKSRNAASMRVVADPGAKGKSTWLSKPTASPVDLPPHPLRTLSAAIRPNVGRAELCPVRRLASCLVLDYCRFVTVLDDRLGTRSDRPSVFGPVFPTHDHADSANELGSETAVTTRKDQRH